MSKTVTVIWGARLCEFPVVVRTVPKPAGLFFTDSYYGPPGTVEMLEYRCNIYAHGRTYQEAAYKAYEQIAEKKQYLSVLLDGPPPDECYT